ncbi:hypothetical protein NE237_015566 [Protea cynaroides]|uniref:CASP-like protein n=1 Tax=Protea cynaroides TaxID=273540 RepID=A0A9Q0QR73_9MAGN|nr:hypothetical protein NE237_015566 [Protea cynaroides]
MMTKTFVIFWDETLRTINRFRGVADWRNSSLKLISSIASQPRACSDAWRDGFSSIFPLEELINFSPHLNFVEKCLFAASSIASMASTSSFFQVTAFCYLIASMALQVIWSFALACLDTYALARNNVLYNPILVSLFVVGDWVTAMMSLAAASSSAGIVVLYTSDLGSWKGEECMKYQISVCMAFFSWIMVGISSFIMLWIMAAG